MTALPVPEGLAGERVDTALARLLGISRTKAADLATAGSVHVDGVAVDKAHLLTAGAWLEVELPPPASPAAAGGTGGPELPVLFDDDHLVVVEKPVGVAAHPSPGWTGPTVVGLLAGAGFRIATSGAAERQGIVHRLDVGTTGLMVVAKSELAYSALKRAFKERLVTKTYHAVVQGHPTGTGTIDAPIGRHPGAEYRFAVVADGKPAVTHYEVLEAVPAASLVEVDLETGRTHQIRVHFAAIHHPCVGDLTYGADPRLAERAGLSRQWLHAVRLGFDHPAKGERLELTSPYPDDLERAWELLRGEG